MCLVAKDLTHEFLLGSDLLYAHGCVIDLKTRLLLAGGEMVTLKLDKPAALVCGAVIMANVTISWNCEIRLMATLAVDGKTYQDDITGLLEPEPSFIEHHGTLYTREGSLYRC